MTAPGGPLDSPGERDAVRLVLVRHAESEANIGGRWQGQGDSPLSERGKSQARALAERIARVGLQPDLVVCSDLRRASETARAAFGDAVEVDPLWREIDLLLVPTAGTIYTIEAVNAEPLALNTNLGYYTNFVNLLDLCAWAVPNGFQSNGLPMGVTLIAPAFQDDALGRLAGTFHRHRQRGLEAIGSA